MLNSLNADMAAFFSGSMLLQNRGTAKMRIEMPRVFLNDTGCPRYQPINERVLFTKKDTLCGNGVYTLDGEGERLRFKSYQFAATNLPVHIRTAELGEVDITGFEIYASFQDGACRANRSRS